MTELQKNLADKETQREKLIMQGLDVALNFDASSPPNQAVFFSGAFEKRAAGEFCRKNPGYTHVCMTPALKAFEELRLFGRESPLTIKEIYDLGDMISERFAKAASGNVTVFVGPKLKPEGTFLRIELPALIENPQVTTINGNPKSDFSYLLEPKHPGPKRKIESARRVTL